MGKLFNIRGVLESLYNSVSSVSKNRFLERPNNTQKPMNDFVVVSIPTKITSTTYGYENYQSECVGRITLFAKDLKGGEQNIVSLQKMVDSTMALFPLHNELITAYKPNIIDLGSDGNGFHAIAIQFKLTIN